ncbi:hypothetical protein FVE85_6354 [Porphyridium purpureum]|uniref:Ribonuclease H2 subunit B wHTH domain-containing protein n=1 Tax=Porphyridium purpureum TaxID=35688 RepID=A0A5J4Z460_PORPP|nr:hypothetical protein FVE85_6354 [Porphyridium purpureum]|eukprot:POR9341..scf295_1
MASDPQEATAHSDPSSVEVDTSKALPLASGTAQDESFACTRAWERHLFVITAPRELLQNGTAVDRITAPDWASGTGYVANGARRTLFRARTQAKGDPQAEVQLYELSSFEPDFGSWLFVRTDVDRDAALAAGKQDVLPAGVIERDGRLYHLTRFDACFLLLPVLSQPEHRGVFQPMDAIFEAPYAREVADYASHARMQRLCDTQDIGEGEFVYRLNEQKVLDWISIKLRLLLALLKKGRQPSSAHGDALDLLAMNLAPEWMEKVRRADPELAAMNAETGATVCESEEKPFLEDVVNYQSMYQSGSGGGTGGEPTSNAPAAKRAKRSIDTKLAKSSKSSKSITSFFGKK